MDRINKLLEFLKDNPADSFLNHALALEYIKLGRDGEAQSLFEKLLAIEPGYVGSYYHLAKLLERMNNHAQAIACYEKGMDMAKAAGDLHAFNELRAAYEELTL